MASRKAGKEVSADALRKRRERAHKKAAQNLLEIPFSESPPKKLLVSSSAQVSDLTALMRSRAQFGFELFVGATLIVHARLLQAVVRIVQHPQNMLDDVWVSQQVAALLVSHAVPAGGVTSKVDFAVVPPLCVSVTL